MRCPPPYFESYYPRHARPTRLITATLAKKTSSPFRAVVVDADEQLKKQVRPKSSGTSSGARVFLRTVWVIDQRPQPGQVLLAERDEPDSRHPENLVTR
jgi:hypothetical protein